MWKKGFQVLLVTFLMLFTAAILVLIVGPLASVLVGPNTNGIASVQGGVSSRAINLVLIAFVLLIFALTYFIARRKQRR